VGDVLGLVDGQVVVIDSERNELACAFLVIDELVQDTVELVTVITGAGVANLADLEKSLRSRHPDVEFVVLAGGQPLWPFLIGAE
jgi:dihydroxyacetone kinase-like predicted kinase